MNNHVDAILTTAREAVAAASLPLATARGWNADVLEQAVTDAGVDLPLAARAFPRGLDDLVLEIDARWDRKMEFGLAERNLDEVRYRDQVALAINIRFASMEAHREAVKAAIAYHTLPVHAADGARALARTADSVWRSLDDRSMDFNFYTKRATLAAVLAATTLVWTRDPKGNEWPGFLNRRLTDAVRMRKARIYLHEAATDIIRRRSIMFRRGFPAGWTVWPDSPPTSTPPPRH